MQRHLPGFAQIANLKIANKLGLIVVVLAIPICALVFVQYQDQQAATSQANSESDGLDYVSTVMPFMTEVQRHRALVERVLNGEEAARANMELTAVAADEALAQITRSDSRWGNRFETRELVAFLNAEWPRARDAEGSSQESNSLHNSVIQQGVFPLLATIATESGLLLDPDLDTRNVIVALTETLPRMTDALSLMRSHGAGALASRPNQAAREDTKEFLSAQSALATFQAEQLARQLETAMANNQRFETDLRPIVTRSTNARNTFVGTTQTSIMNASSLSETGAEGYFLLGGSAIDLSNQLLTSAQTALQADFDARASTAQKDFALYGSAAIIGIILALGLAVFISATITRPMTHLAEVADRMSLGELDVEIDVDGSNEIGQLAESLRRMQSSLRSAIERLRQRRAAA
jgi:methyl-accepting chemotaxis protein